MAEVPQANPCSECPFRRNSLKGYVGGHKHFAEILDIVHLDGKFPCHMRVTAIIARERGGADNQVGQDAYARAVDLAPFCTGALAYMANTAKLVRHPSAIRYADVIGRRDDVFGDPIEAQAYHHGTNDVRAMPLAATGGAKLPTETVVQWLQRKADRGALPEAAARAAMTPLGSHTTGTKSESLVEKPSRTGVSGVVTPARSGTATTRSESTVKRSKGSSKRKSAGASRSVVNSAARKSKR